MTAVELIDKNYSENKPYQYAKIWKLYTGTDYRRLSRISKKFWRWAVRDRAEYGDCRPLPSPEIFKYA